GDGTSVHRRDAFGKAPEAAQEGVLDVAAEHVLLREADEQEGEQPLDAVDHCSRTEESAAIEHKQMERVEGAHDGGQYGQSPESAGQYIRDAVTADAVR